MSPSVVESKHLIYDPWLAGILNRKVYHLRIDEDFIHRPGNEGLWPEGVRESLFADCKVPTDFLAGVQYLEKRGFSLVDTNLTFEKPRTNARKENQIKTARLATPQDKKAVMELARTGFKYSRFHLDPEIPKEVADTVKAEWAGNFFIGKRGEQMVVSEREGKIIGFLQLLKPDGKALIIDLIAVAPEARGQGIACEMIQFVETQNSKADLVRVGTQVANVPSIRLYEKLGFRHSSSSYVFHYHENRLV